MIEQIGEKELSVVLNSIEALKPGSQISKVVEIISEDGLKTWYVSVKVEHETKNYIISSDGTYKPSNRGAEGGGGSESSNP